MRMMQRRLTRLEATHNRKARSYVVCAKPGETTEQALSRFFEGGETWPVVVLPEPCSTVDEWLSRHSPARSP